uniref:Uncharacterized protein n=1 Tax=Ananas comosus var. bracteatus TaxID=296719 RepID=A0A6V7QBX8_ANACO|nr:unnamed protein product [Ananas comosus var. bracteatus]
MEEKVAEAVVEAQSQEDTTILLLTKLAFERTMQALSLHTDKAETVCLNFHDYLREGNILKCLADFLGIKLGDIKYDDSFAGESVLLHHDVALEAYKAVLRILILKEESITLERCRLLMRFVCNIGISLEDAYSILDETMKESDTDRLARNTSVMQDHRGLDRKDDTMIQRKRNVELELPEEVQLHHSFSNVATFKSSIGFVKLDLEYFKYSRLSLTEPIDDSKVATSKTSWKHGRLRASDSISKDEQPGSQLQPGT